MATDSTAGSGCLPSPLWGGEGGGGLAADSHAAFAKGPPFPSLPHNGGREAPNPALLRLTLTEAVQ